MSDIFISYAREDLDRVRPLARALEAEGWSVFWDRRIPPGKTWHDLIEGELTAARVVVVAWSAAANASEWVREEAAEGRKRRILVPVILDELEPPLGFRAIHAADLVGWQGDTAAEGFIQLTGAIAAIVEPRKVADDGSINRPMEDIPAATPAAQPVRMSENGGVELVLIPGGAFLMGSPEDEEGRWEAERPQHEVIVKPFYLGRYFVTNEEYERFMKAVPKVQEPKYWGDRQFNQAKQPVVGVSWDDAQRLAEWVGGRLPTEAEWEYAARAGTTTRYWWGDEVGKNHANCDGCGSQWDNKQTAPVGSFAPNPFGLYDMLGNVWEWVQDCWHENYHGAPVDGLSWRKEHGGDCDQRVIRGGSWNLEPWDVRSAYRYRFAPDARLLNLGFRLAQDI